MSELTFTPAGMTINGVDTNAMAPFADLANHDSH